MEKTLFLLLIGLEVRKSIRWILTVEMLRKLAITRVITQNLHRSPDGSLIAFTKIIKGKFVIGSYD